jgi:hypothetical protein
VTAPLPDFEHRPGEVTFRGEALKMLNGAIDAGLREKRGAGWSIEPYRRAKFAVLAAYRSQAMSVRGHQMDESAAPDRQLGGTDGARLLSTREAATEIGCSVRHARRLAAEGHGFRLVGQNWVFREGDVRALKQDFEERNGHGRSANRVSRGVGLCRAA